MWTLRLTISLLILATVVGAPTACRRGQELADIRVEIVSIQPAPPVVGPAELRLRLRDGNGKPVTGLGSVEVEGTMSHAGMKPVLVQAREVGDGVYTTEGFQFTMAGDWIIIVRGSLDGRAFEAQATVSGVRSGSSSPVTPSHEHTTDKTPTPQGHTNGSVASSPWETKNGTENAVPTS